MPARNKFSHILVSNNERGFVNRRITWNVGRSLPLIVHLDIADNHHIAAHILTVTLSYIEIACNVGNYVPLFLKSSFDPILVVALQRLRKVLASLPLLLIYYDLKMK